MNSFIWLDVMNIGVTSIFNQQQYFKLGKYRTSNSLNPLYSNEFFHSVGYNEPGGHIYI